MVRLQRRDDFYYDHDNHYHARPSTYCDNHVVDTHPRAHDVVAATADRLGYSWRPIPSGATHDAVHMAALAPMAMIFVPSRGGRSHCPEEWTDPLEIGRGVHVLGETLRALDTAPL